MSLTGVRRVREGHHRGDPHRDLRPCGRPAAVRDRHHHPTARGPRVRSSEMP